MLFKKRPGFSFLDMMMYVSLVALTLHYAVPSYKLITSKIQSQSLIREAQQAKLQIYEHFLLTGHFPDSEELESYGLPDDVSIDWDGSALQIGFLESQSAQPSQLILTPQADEYRIQWSCEYNGSASLKTYLCYALT